MTADGGPVVARLVRNGVVESVHTGHVVVTAADGTVLGYLGSPQRLTYPRSTIKPFQALGVLAVTDAAGVELDDDALAIMCASHDGSDDQQIQAARLLAEAGLDESALQCPPAVPRDPDTAWLQRWPYSLSHNCSGKHAGFLLATALAGEDPAEYLAPHSPLQQRIRAHLADVCGAEPEGPGVDGCGAPAWLLPLHSLARGFARLAVGEGAQLGRIRRAMTSRPLLVGGATAADSQLMQADPAIVAKRGAEAVFAAGTPDHGGIGVAVKITDGSGRADGPVAANVLRALGCHVPRGLRSTPVHGGGRVQGALEVDPAVGRIADLRGP